MTAPYEQYLQEYFVRNTVSPSKWNILSRVIQQIPGAAAKLQEYLSLMNPTIEWLVASTGFALNGYCRLQIDGHLTQGEADTYLIMTGRRGPRGDGLNGVSDFGLSVEDLLRFMSFLRQVVSTRQMRQALDEQRAFIYGSELLAAPGCARTARDALFQTGRSPPSRGLSETFAPPGSNISSNAANLLGQWSAPSPGLPTKVVVDPSEASTCALALGPDLRTLQDGAPSIPLSARYGSMRILKDDAVRALRAFMPRVAAKDDYPAFAAYLMRGTPTLPAPSSIAAICSSPPLRTVPTSPSVVIPPSSPPTSSDNTLFMPAGERFAAFRPLIDANRI